MVEAVLKENHKVTTIGSSSEGGNSSLKSLRFVVLSDTHCRQSKYYDKIPSGDVLLHCGDFTNRGTMQEIESFNQFLGKLKNDGKIKMAICIGGNHDYMMDPKYNKSLNADLIWNTKRHPLLSNCDYYLWNNSIIIDGSIKVYGSPMQEMGMAFNGSNLYNNYWKNMDGDADIVLSHNPPYNILDLAWVRGIPGAPCKTCQKEHSNAQHWGDFWLRNQLLHCVQPTIACFGHVHDETGPLKYTVEQLIGEENYHKDIYNVQFNNPSNDVDKKKILTFLNAAVDLTHTVYFFDYFWGPTCKFEKLKTNQKKCVKCDG